MKLLLDTHAYLWAMMSGPRLSTAASRAISDPDNELLLSVGSLWEAAIKIGKGTLVVPGHSVQFLLDNMDRFSVQGLSIEARHLRALETLPLWHRDPFDRLIVAQALSDALTVITVDKALKAYGINVLW